METPAIKEPLYLILASICVIIGVAGLGYLTNDLGDRKKDLIISKQNVTNSLSPFSITVLILLFLSFALIPWVYLPVTLYSLFLLLFQFFLFYAYAFRPFRFKEKGFLGVLTDALYAHVTPAVLAAYTFYLLDNVPIKDFILFLILLGSWQFVLGIRNIILHQIKDYDNDIITSTKTYVTFLTKRKAYDLCNNFLLPLELMLLMGFTLFISKFSYLFIVLMLTYWIVVSIRHKISLLRINSQLYLYLDILYINWIPLFILTVLCIKGPQFYPVLILHFLIFRGDFQHYVLKYLNLRKRLQPFFK